MSRPGASVIPYAAHVKNQTPEERALVFLQRTWELSGGAPKESFRDWAALHGISPEAFDAWLARTE